MDGIGWAWDRDDTDTPYAGLQQLAEPPGEYSIFLATLHPAGLSSSALIPINDHSAGVDLSCHIMARSRWGIVSADPAGPLREPAGRVDTGKHGMPIHNAVIAATFTEIADLLEIEQANPFRIGAYRKAARIARARGLKLNEYGVFRGTERIAGAAARGGDAVNWETFPHEADIGVRGTGATMAEAFAGAATALTAVVCDPAAVGAAETTRIECTAPDDELLLLDWLNALIYEMATRRLLFSRFAVRITGHRLRATAWGSTFPAACARCIPASSAPTSSAKRRRWPISCLRAFPPGSAAPAACVSMRTEWMRCSKAVRAGPSSKASAVRPTSRASRSTAASQAPIPARFPSRRRSASATRWERSVPATTISKSRSSKPSSTPPRRAPMAWRRTTWR
ncbi:putative uncharacterized protein [Burkholderiales bacterium GJ-E10]|nr:putative uncharacterized protein [Burkholderiales bacterium GJ-E10]